MIDALLIDDFVARYRKEFDFYDQAGRLAAQILEGRLQSGGIRSRVTSRAKSIKRLEEKVRQRAEEKQYLKIEDVCEDIIDLAGVRVERYFPAQVFLIESVINDLFHVTGSKVFPNTQSITVTPLPTITTYKNRFSGYSARHYHIYLRDSSLSEAQRRYSEARVEIQVASVLMHAWAEVNHDLVYKPLQGELSNDEYAILDKLNGLVIAGEIDLEHLQRAGEARVAAVERPFKNHYELAAHLLSAAGATLRGPEATTAIGEVDLLFELLSRYELATPNGLKPFLDVLHQDTERRPFAEQIIDQFIAEDEDRYKAYEEIRAKQQDVGTELRERPEPELQEAIGFFLTEWIGFERAVREIAVQQGALAQNGRPLFPTSRILARIGVLDKGTRCSYCYHHTAPPGDRRPRKKFRRNSRVSH
jgi:ppGpp synthetase/RelA/SpoT-type nucleotidyltranferase